MKQHHKVLCVEQQKKKLKKVNLSLHSKFLKKSTGGRNKEVRVYMLTESFRESHCVFALCVLPRPEKRALDVMLMCWRVVKLYSKMLVVVVTNGIKIPKEMKSLCERALVCTITSPPTLIKWQGVFVTRICLMCALKMNIYTSEASVRCETLHDEAICM